MAPPPRSIATFDDLPSYTLFSLGRTQGSRCGLLGGQYESPGDLCGPRGCWLVSLLTAVFPLKVRAVPICRAGPLGGLCDPPGGQYGPSEGLRRPVVRQSGPLEVGTPEVSKLNPVRYVFGDGQSLCAISFIVLRRYLGLCNARGPPGPST